MGPVSAAIFRCGLEYLREISLSPPFESSLSQRISIRPTPGGWARHFVRRERRIQDPNDLRVVHITEREYRDIIALLHDHVINDSNDPEAINGSYLAMLCSKDWAIYKTLIVNITNILNSLSEFQLDENYQKVVRNRLIDLKEGLERHPKSTMWKARAKIGERKKWYELPEEDKEVVSQRDLRMKTVEK